MKLPGVKLHLAKKKLALTKLAEIQREEGPQSEPPKLEGYTPYTGWKVQIRVEWQPPSAKAWPEYTASTLGTPRLVIRPATEADAAELLQVWLANTDHLMPWIPFARGSYQTLETMTQKLKRNATDAAEMKHIQFIIVERSSGSIIGQTGFNHIQSRTGCAHTGYWISHDRCKQGIASEVARHMISWGLRPTAEGGWGLRRLILACDEPNTGSLRVLQKLGIREEGRAVEDHQVEGHGWVTDVSFAVLAHEWCTSEHRIYATGAAPPAWLMMSSDISSDSLCRLE